MEVYNKNHDERNHEDKPIIEPIRGSLFILTSKILVILLLFDFLYIALFYVLNLGVILPFDLHHHLAVLFIIGQLLKIGLQVGLVLNVVLSWAGNVHHLTNQHIIKRTGIFNVNEEIYHYENIRSISINQSFMGKLFSYGDITLKTSASGGYQGDIVIVGVDNPKKYEEILKTFF